MQLSHTFFEKQQLNSDAFTVIAFKDLEMILWPLIVNFSIQENIIHRALQVSHVAP